MLEQEDLYDLFTESLETGISAEYLEEGDTDLSESEQMKPNHSPDSIESFLGNCWEDDGISSNLEDEHIPGRASAEEKRAVFERIEKWLEYMGGSGREELTNFLSEALLELKKDPSVLDVYKNKLRNKLESIEKQIEKYNQILSTFKDQGVRDAEIKEPREFLQGIAEIKESFEQSIEEFYIKAENIRV